MTTEQSSSGRLVELDALRGIGAIAVVLFHLTTRFPEIFPKADHIPVRFWAGEYRVLLFFAISGFAIFFTMDRLKYASDFIVNRMSRLLPAYWVAMCLTLAFVHFGDVTPLQIPLLPILANLTMLQSYFYLPAVDGAYWTLEVEIGFYASMLCIWAVIGFGRLERIALGWLALRWLMYFWQDMPSRVAAVMVLQYVPFFIIGMLFYRIWSGQRSWPAQIPFFAAALSTVLVIDGVDMALAGCGLILIFWAALAGGLRFLCVRPILWFGSISYSLYLVHQNIGFVIMLKAHEAGLGHWSGFALALMIVVLLAWALNSWVERPVGRAIGQYWKSWKASREHATASQQALSG